MDWFTLINCLHYHRLFSCMSGVIDIAKRDILVNYIPFLEYFCTLFFNREREIRLYRALAQFYQRVRVLTDTY